MLIPIHYASAGTDSSSDVVVVVYPNSQDENIIKIESEVKSIFGGSIEATVRDELNRNDVHRAVVEINDRGALDFAIRARLLCTLYRSADQQYNWKSINIAQAKKSNGNSIQLLRSSLYAGGTSPKRMVQAIFYHEDCIVYDLEDSVSEAEKDSARFLICCLLKYQRPERKHVVVRVNGLYSNYFNDDLEAIVRFHPDAIRLPKIESAEEVKNVSKKITEIESEADIDRGSTKLWCNIESYNGIINANEIAKADSRIEALALGAEDLTASLRATRTKEGWEILYARNILLMACRSAGISAQDAVFSDFTDEDGLRKDLQMTKTLGFDGKTCIHPSQIDIVNSAFTPNEKEVRHAVEVMEALNEARENHTGVCKLHGEMIDSPAERRALLTLEEARASGLSIKEMTND